MMGSKLSLLATLALAIGMTAAVSAQSNLKIGVVSVARLVEQSPQAATVTKTLTDEFGPRQRELTAMQERLRTQTETFQRDSAVMGEQERVNLERQIRDGQRELERSQNVYLEDLNLRRNELVNTLQREILQKAQEYARAQQYDLLLADPNIIFASTAVDITEAVLRMLQPAGAAAPPASAPPASTAPAPAPSGRGNQPAERSERRSR
jgi:outer membrane protein